MLNGKTALVTGSTSGIGLAIAKSLGENGANVMFNGLGDLSAMEAERKQLEAERKIKTAYNNSDLSKPAEVRRMVEETQKAFGGVDILVNNAGIQFVAPVEEFPDEKWDAIIAINLSSAFHACKHVFADMKKKKWGRIVNVCSAHGLRASPFKVAYVSAKHGIMGLTKTLALEGAEFGVRVNSICPGYVWTPLVEKQIPDTMKARNMTAEQVKRDVLLERQPTKEFATVEEIAGIALFLCSPAADQITGTAISADGGWTAQ
jgi:3-hydroxybutyrate dehydrogenase